MVDPVTQTPTAVKFRRDESNRRVRVASNSGAVLPKPAGPAEKPKKTYNPTCDTAAEDVWKQTYFPKFVHHTKFRAMKAAQAASADAQSA
eukprot:TRINITY_DN85375_c0_g1_i1.p1 TRINITY_DN85375_c0_g1~~TRINITY_DN85375_c0_g1_i1.p1  ORF type:complete len:103 (+),score=20.75 TRINITY_DN85375_c0_g1_i1:41-310(+)